MRHDLLGDLLGACGPGAPRPCVPAHLDVLVRLKRPQVRLIDEGAHAQVSKIRHLGEDVANFHAEHFQNGIGRRNHLHLGDLRVDVSKLGARLGHAHPGGFHVFLLRFRRADRALSVIWGDDFAFEQIRLTFRIVAQEIELRLLRIGIVNGGIDLRRGQIAPRLQLSCFQLHDWLTGT